MRGGRNERLDVIRCIGAYCVVFIHVPLPGTLGVVVNCLARFAVPLFFLSAGYFSSGASPQVLLNRAWKSLKLLGLACILPALLECSVMVGKGEALGGYLPWLLQPQHIIEFLALQLLPFTYAAPLWFLAALAMIYLLWWGLTSLLGGKGLPYPLLAGLAVVALAVHLALGEGRALLGLEPVESVLLRNLWLDGLPFFALGTWMGSRREVLQERLSLKRCGGLVVLGALLALAARTRTGYLDLHFGAVLMALGAMGAAVCAPELKHRTGAAQLLARGGSITFAVYSLHVPVYGLIKEGGRYLPAVQALKDSPVLLPLVVAGVTTGLSLALLGIQGARRNRRLA